MLPSRLTYRLILVAGLVTALASCGKAPQEEEHSSRELSVLFSANTGLVGDAYNELILQGVMESTAAGADVGIHLLKPANLSEARAQDNFRKMLLIMETCYSGSIGEGLPGIPGLLLLTAAAPGEKSHADVLEDTIYLSNAFTRVFREQVENNPDITLYELYTELARHTTASHAMIYNYEWYGSVYYNSLSEFFATDY